MAGRPITRTRKLLAVQDELARVFERLEKLVPNWVKTDPMPRFPNSKRWQQVDDGAFVLAAFMLELTDSIVGREDSALWRWFEKRGERPYTFTCALRSVEPDTGETIAGEPPFDDEDPPETQEETAENSAPGV